MEDNRRKTNVWTALALLIILTGALLIRVYNLGGDSFWMDELLHVHAAQGLLQTGELVHPNGMLYPRAWPFTYMVAGMFEFFGVSEFTARLPGVFFGLMTILMTFYVTRKWFGAGAAVVAAVLVGFAPLCIDLSRECRMYTMFQFLYLCLAFTVYQSLELAGSRASLRRGLFFLFSVLLLALSYLIHQLTVFIFASAAAYLLCVGIGQRKARRRANFKNQYFLILLFMAAAGAAVVLLKPEFVDKLLTKAAYNPPWSAANNHILYYKWMLEDWYPVFFYGFPVAAIYLWMRHRKPGVYVTLNFVIPFLMSSLFFARKENRYFLPFLTFFLIAAAPVLAFILKWSFSKIRQLATIGVGYHVFILRSVAPVILLPVVLYLANPWFGAGIEKVRHPTNLPWKETVQMFDEAFHEDAVLITNAPYPLMHYTDLKTMYWIDMYEDESTKRKYSEEMKKVDLPKLNRVADFSYLKRKNKGRDIWILMDGFKFFEIQHVNQEMRKYLISEAVWFDVNGNEIERDKLGNFKREILIGKIKG